MPPRLTTVVGGPVPASGAPAAPRPRRATPAATTIVQAPPAAPPAEQKRRKGRRGAARSSSKGDVMQRTNLKDGIVAGVAAIMAPRLTAGKSTGGIPNTALFAAGAAYIDDGKTPMLRAASTGLYAAAAMEYVLLGSIRDGKLDAYLAPYLEAAIAEGGETKNRALAYKAALSGTAPAAATTPAAAAGAVDEMANRWASGG